MFASVPMLEYPAKVHLFAQDEVPECVYFIVSGIVKLSCLEPIGKEVIVALRYSGWPLGATAVILDKPSPTRATTLIACRLKQISKREFIDRLKTQEHFPRHLHEVQAKEVLDHLENLVEVATRPTQYRLVRLLYEIAQEIHSQQPPEHRSLQVPLKQREIAQLLTITPEHTSRVLRRLKLDGLIKQEDRLLSVPNLKALRSFIDP